MCGYIIHFTLSTHHGRIFSRSRPRMSYGSVFVLFPKCLVPGLSTVDVCRIWNLNRSYRMMDTINVNRDHRINLSGCNVISFLQVISDWFICFKGTVLIEAWFNSGIVEFTLLVSRIMTSTTFTYTCLSCHISHNLGCTAQTTFRIPCPWKTEIPDFYIFILIKPKFQQFILQAFKQILTKRTHGFSHYGVYNAGISMSGSSEHCRFPWTIGPILRLCYCNPELRGFTWQFKYFQKKGVILKAIIFFVSRSGSLSCKYVIPYNYCFEQTPVGFIWWTSIIQTQSQILCSKFNILR